MCDSIPCRIWERSFPGEETSIIIKYSKRDKSYTVYSEPAGEAAFFEERYLPDLIKGLQEELNQRKSKNGH